MFQTFTNTSSPEQSPPRVIALRETLAASGIAAYIVPRADVHQGEYVAESDARLEWLTGFTGSAGRALITAERAAMLVDGRYTIQAREQTDAMFEVVFWPETRVADWLAEALPQGGTVGYHDWLMTVEAEAQLAEALSKKNIALQPTGDLIGEIWADRPARPSNPITPQPLELTGKPHAEKRDELAKTLRDEGQDLAIFTLPEDICWLLNIRGHDIPCNPLSLCFAIARCDGTVVLFTDAEATPELAAHLGDDVALAPYGSFADALAKLSGVARIAADSCPARVLRILREAGVEVAEAENPIALPKACKTEAEQEGMRQAHIRDAVAMARFLHWFETHAAPTTLTEIDLVQTLEAYRRETDALLDISFDTISGSGPHGAVIHYRVTEKTNRKLQDGELVVLDSGGQYRDGTTDVTRVLTVGTPPQEAITAYTLVLKGMIAISRLRFPPGVTGGHIDVMARAALWQRGLDYDHGTGHGVGAYLCVHEGPQNISRRSTVPLEAGMILSNEPGYYKAGAFGIRIENLLITHPAAAVPGGDATRAFHYFETLTYVPLNKALINVGMLNDEERAWIDGYHAEIYKRIGTDLNDPERAWLKNACTPL